MYTFPEKPCPARIETTYLWYFFVIYMLFLIEAAEIKSNRVSHDKINIKKFIMNDFDFQSTNHL